MTDDTNHFNLEKRQVCAIVLNTAGGAASWLEQRLSSYSRTKELYVLVITAMVAFIGGPALIFFFMNWLLAGSLGTSGGGPAAIAFSRFLHLLLFFFVGVSGWMVIKSSGKPTHLLLSSEGLRYQYKTLLGAFQGRLIAWDKITELTIVKPKNRTNPAEYRLCFLAGAKPLSTLRLGWIDKTGDRQRLFEYVEEFLPDTPRSLDVAFYLQPPSGHSYTEIWFQSLDNAPNLATLACNNQPQVSIRQQDKTREVDAPL